jgi:hypothetical protein
MALNYDENSVSAIADIKGIYSRGSDTCTNLKLAY